MGPLGYIVLYFILTDGPGAILPIDVHHENMQCGKPGVVVGVQLDREVNPTLALWPDPFFPGVHCEVDISGKVASLDAGEYHVATTEMTDGTGVPYIGIDPHVSPYWQRVRDPFGLPTAPTGFKFRPPE